MAVRNSPDFPELNDRPAGVWDRIAEWWDDRIGDGNATQDLLVEPAQDRLLALEPGERVLEIACGAGRYARRMAAAGARVVAFDHSSVFLERARSRTTEHADRIEYRELNATDPDALCGLGEAGFDAAVCTMALMDLASIEPLISTLPGLLKPGGRFVFSVTHPAFNSGTAKLFGEEEYRRGDLRLTYGVKVTEYLSAMQVEGIGIPGQPEPQHYFHRPIGMLFNTCFEHGFVLDAMEEPAIPPGHESSSKRPLTFARMPEIPQVLVARMRVR